MDWEEKLKELSWSSLKTGPARKNMARFLKKNLTTTDTHEFIQLFL